MTRYKNIDLFSVVGLTYDEFAQESNIKRYDPFSTIIDDIITNEEVLTHKKSLIEQMITGDEALQKAKKHVDSLGLNDFNIEYDTPELGQRQDYYELDQGSKELKKTEVSLSSGQSRSLCFYFPNTYFVFITFTKEKDSFKIPLMIDAFTGLMQNQYAKEQIISTYELAKQRTIVVTVEDSKAEQRLHYHLSNDDGVKEIVSVHAHGLGERLRKQETYKIKPGQAKRRERAIIEDDIIEQISPEELEREHD